MHMVRAQGLIPYIKRDSCIAFSLSLVLGHVLSPVRFLPRHSLFADCKLYIRTRLLAPAFSNFWKNPSNQSWFLSIPSDGVNRRWREALI